MAISEKEFARRYKAIRMLMEEEGIDCLVVAGRSDYFGRGNIRYVTGLAFGGHAIFPLEGKPIYFLSTNQIASPKHRRAAPVDDLMVLKELLKPAEQIKEELLRFDGGRKIGIVGMNDIQVPVYLALKEFLGERLVDGTAIFARLRPVKSEEEIEKMRVAASIADRVCTMLRQTITPGLTDYEIYGSVKKAIYGMKADYSMELIDADGSRMNMAWGPSGDRLEEKGTLFLEYHPRLRRILRPTSRHPACGRLHTCRQTDERGLGRGHGSNKGPPQAGNESMRCPPEGSRRDQAKRLHLPIAGGPCHRARRDRLLEGGREQSDRPGGGDDHRFSSLRPGGDGRHWHGPGLHFSHQRDWRGEPQRHRSCAARIERRSGA